MTLSKIINIFRKKNKKTPHVLGAGQNVGYEYIQMEDDRPGNYRSSFNVQLATPTDTKVRFKVYTDNNGGIILGNNQRIKFDETGLTDVRTFTFPDSDTTLIGSPVDSLGIGPTISTPANPNTNYSKLYIKTVDSNNDGIFALIKRNGSFVEVQIL